LCGIRALFAKGSIAHLNSLQLMKCSESKSIVTNTITIFVCAPSVLAALFVNKRQHHTLESVAVDEVL